MASAASTETGAPLLRRQSSVVPEDAARLIFQQYDKDGNGKINSAELRDLAYELGETLDDTQLATVLKELDKDGSGDLDFDEFYSWLTDPNRESTEMTFQTRLLQSRLALKYYRRKAKALGSAVKAQAKSVSVDPTRSIVELLLQAGDVPETGAPLEVTVTGAPGDAAPEPPDVASGAIIMTTNFEVAASATDEEVGELIAAIQTQMDENGVEQHLAMANAVVKFAYPNTLENGRKCVAIMVEMTPPGGDPFAQAQAFTGGVDPTELTADSTIRLALNKSLVDIATSQAGDLKDLAFSLHYKSEWQRTAMDAAATAIDAVTEGIEAMSSGGNDMPMNPAMLAGMPGAGPTGGIPPAMQMALMAQGPQTVMMMAKAGKFIRGLTMLREVTLRTRFDCIGDIVEKVEKDNADSFPLYTFSGQEKLDMAVEQAKAAISAGMVPDFALDLYRSARTVIRGFAGFQFWAQGKAYVRVNVEGFDLDFLPTPQELGI